MANSFVGKPPGLVEDLLGNGNLADVVEGGGGADHGYVRRGEAVLVRPAHQLRQQGLGEYVHMAHVHPALPVAELHDMAEYVDHQVAAPFLLIDLLRHQDTSFFCLAYSRMVFTTRRWTMSASKGRLISR